MLIIAHLAIHMASNTNLVSASSGLFDLLAGLTGSYITTKQCLLLLNLAHLSITRGCRWPISVTRHAGTRFRLSLHGLGMRSCEAITVILGTVCIRYECLILVCSCRVLAYVHELWHRRLLNIWFRKLLVNSLINRRSVGIRFCACPAALVINRWCTLFLLTLQQLLHQLVVLVDRERFSTLAMSWLHLLVDTWALNHTLRVVMLRATCLKGSGFPWFSVCSFTVYWIVWLVLVGGKICWRCFLHLIYWTVRLLPIVLCCEMRCYSSLVVM